MEKCFSCAVKGECSELYVKKPLYCVGPYFPIFERFNPPSISNSISTDGTVKVCKLCKIYLYSQWESFESHSIPESRRMYFTKRHDSTMFNSNGSIDNYHNLSENNSLKSSGYKMIENKNRHISSNNSSISGKIEPNDELVECNRSITEYHISCFVCGQPCLKCNSKTAYSSQVLENKEYFPFLEKLDPPALSISLVNGATKICVDCESNLLKQWDDYEKKQTDQRARIYHISYDHSSSFSINNPGRFISNSIPNNQMLAYFKSRNAAVKCALCHNKIIDSYIVSWNQARSHSSLFIPNLRNFNFNSDGIIVDCSLQEAIICDICHYFLTCQLDNYDSNKIPLTSRDYRIPKKGQLPRLMSPLTTSTNNIPTTPSSSSLSRPSPTRKSAFQPTESSSRCNQSNGKLGTANHKSFEMTLSANSCLPRQSCQICNCDLMDPSSIKILRSEPCHINPHTPYFPFLKSCCSEGSIKSEHLACMHCYCNLQGQWTLYENTGVGSINACIPIADRLYKTPEIICNMCHGIFPNKSDTIIIGGNSSSNTPSLVGLGIEKIICVTCFDKFNEGFDDKCNNREKGSVVLHNRCQMPSSSSVAPSVVLSGNSNLNSATSTGNLVKSRATVTVPPISSALPSFQQYHESVDILGCKTQQLANYSNSLMNKPPTNNSNNTNSSSNNNSSSSNSNQNNPSNSPLINSTEQFHQIYQAQQKLNNSNSSSSQIAMINNSGIQQKSSNKKPVVAAVAPSQRQTPLMTNNNNNGSSNSISESFAAQALLWQQQQQHMEMASRMSKQQMSSAELQQQQLNSAFAAAAASGISPALLSQYQSAFQAASGNKPQVNGGGVPSAGMMTSPTTPLGKSGNNSSAAINPFNVMPSMHNNAFSGVPGLLDQQQHHHQQQQQQQQYYNSLSSKSCSTSLINNHLPHHLALQSSMSVPTLPRHSSNATNTTSSNCTATSSLSTTTNSLNNNNPFISWQQTPPPPQTSSVSNHLLQQQQQQQQQNQQQHPFLNQFKCPPVAAPPSNNNNSSSTTTSSQLQHNNFLQQQQAELFNAALAAATSSTNNSTGGMREQDMEMMLNMLFYRQLMQQQQSEVSASLSAGGNNSVATGGVGGGMATNSNRSNNNSATTAAVMHAHQQQQQLSAAWQQYQMEEMTKQYWYMMYQALMTSSSPSSLMSNGNPPPTTPSALANAATASIDPTSANQVMMMQQLLASLSNPGSMSQPSPQQSKQSSHPWSGLFDQNPPQPRAPSHLTPSSGSHCLPPGVVPPPSSSHLLNSAPSASSSSALHSADLMRYQEAFLMMKNSSAPSAPVPTVSSSSNKQHQLLPPHLDESALLASIMLQQQQQQQMMMSDLHSNNLPSSKKKSAYQYPMEDQHNLHLNHYSSDISTYHTSTPKKHLPSSNQIAAPIPHNPSFVSPDMSSTTSVSSSQSNINPIHKQSITASLGTQPDEILDLSSSSISSLHPLLKAEQSITNFHKKPNYQALSQSFSNTRTSSKSAYAIDNLTQIPDNSNPNKSFNEFLSTSADCQLDLSLHNISIKSEYESKQSDLCIEKFKGILHKEKAFKLIALLDETWFEFMRSTNSKTTSLPLDCHSRTNRICKLKSFPSIGQLSRLLSDISQYSLLEQNTPINDDNQSAVPAPITRITRSKSHYLHHLGLTLAAPKHQRKEAQKIRDLTSHFDEKLQSESPEICAAQMRSSTNRRWNRLVRRQLKRKLLLQPSQSSSHVRRSLMRPVLSSGAGIVRFTHVRAKHEAINVRTLIKILNRCV